MPVTASMQHLKRASLMASAADSASRTATRARTAKAADTANPLDRAGRMAPAPKVEIFESRTVPGPKARAVDSGVPMRRVARAKAAAQESEHVAATDALRRPA